MSRLRKLLIGGGGVGSVLAGNLFLNHSHADSAAAVVEQTYREHRDPVVGKAYERSDKRWRASQLRRIDAWRARPALVRAVVPPPYPNMSGMLDGEPE